MSDNSFEVPSVYEKLSHKFILDALKENITKTEEPTVADQLALPLEVEPEPLATPACVAPTPLPEDKKYFRIGEVADVVGVETHVLRYWESEFKTIKPTKSQSGHRVYSRKDVQTLLYIKKLLHEEKFSLKGAKQKLQETKKEAKITAPKVDTTFLKTVSKELKELMQLLRTNPGEL